MDFEVLEQPLPHQHTDVPGLIAVWERAVLDLIDAAELAGPEHWSTPSPCPGWSVGDLVAHVTSIERYLMGRSDPPHEPDYGSLPHAVDGLSRITEIPVDLRRSRARDEVLTEARATAAERLAELLAGPHGEADEIPGPFGRPMTVPAVLRMRTFDIWMHEQDIRVAVDMPGHLDTPAAWSAARTIVAALGYVWVKKVAAPPGSVAHLHVTGPGVSFSLAVAHLPSKDDRVPSEGDRVPSEERRVSSRGDRATESPIGRGELVAPVAHPHTELTVSFPDFVALAGGRVPAERGRELCTIDGDRALGESLATNLSITP